MTLQIKNKCLNKLIICDWNRTLFRLETNKLYSDCLFFLDKLKTQNLILISQSKAGNKIDRKQINKYFKEIIFGTKKISLFKKLKQKFKVSECWVVGDKLNSEIYFGNVCNCQTIRIMRGKFKSQIPKNQLEQPRFIVNNLKQAAKIILSK